MKSSPFFSIIVPVYNVEPYINQCILSCLNQTFKDFEIIIVDDASTDQSMKIVNSYKDHRIHIVANTHNMGLFFSRIIGEKQANGNYFLCLDSDDYFDENLLEKLYGKIIQEYKTDIITFKCKSFPSYKHIYNFHKNQELSLHNFYSWGKCYKKELIFKMHSFLGKAFPRINNSEDVLRSLILYSLSKSYTHLDFYGYFYRIRSDSITHQNNQKKILDILKNIKEISEKKYYALPLTKEALKILKSAYWIEQRYEKNYLLCCVRAFNQLPRAKTFLRSLLYIFTFGRIKI